MVFIKIKGNTNLQIKGNTGGFVIQWWHLVAMFLSISHFRVEVHLKSVQGIYYTGKL